MITTTHPTVVCPGLFTPILAPDGILCRLRIPGGALASDQAIALANFCDLAQITQIQVTNRANLQLRNVPPHLDFTPLQIAGLTGPIPATDHLRNIMVSPLSGSGTIDTRPLVPCLDRLLSTHPEFVHLSPKFSLGLDGGEALSIRGFANDLAFYGVEGHFELQLGDQGFRLAVTDTVPVVEALIGVYLDRVDRNAPKPPRFTALVGREVFARAIAPWTTPCEGLAKPPATIPMPVGLWQALGGTVGINLPLGNITVAQLRGLGAIARDLGDGLLRLTPWRNIMLSGIGASNPPDLQTMLKSLHLTIDPNSPWRTLIACSGSTGCAAGLTDTQADAAQIARRLQNANLTIHLSGCDKFCAHRGESDVTLVGQASGDYELRLEGESMGVLPDVIDRLSTWQGSDKRDLRQWMKSGLTQKSKVSRLDYIKDGEEIYRRSFAIIQSETDFSRLPHPNLTSIAIRLIHTCGMPDIIKHLDAHPDAVESARKALNSGATILCDSKMVAEGITRARLPKDNPVVCTLADSQTPAIAKQIGNTRSAAALNLWGDRLENAIVAIGNAPTALFYLLEMLDAGAPKPAVILGFPVGFVGAVESKAALAADSRGVPYITLHGRQGGSAMAAAAVNALGKEGI
jgi:ferredoxin-nitrite reductase